VRYLILSDLHANIDALDAVLTAAPAESWDRVIVLGDLVGYGAEPTKVIERVQALNPLATIRGNHDKAACGIEDGSSFNYVARLAAQWTFEALSPEHREYLRALPQGPMTIDETVEICHGAPFDEDHYIFDADDASRALDSATRPLCLFGHTHLPVVFRRNPNIFDGFLPEGPDDSTVEIDPGLNYLINVGSVGQPRDGDPRAAYAIVDVEKRCVEMLRLSYAVEAAQAKVMKAGLPDVLAQRLGVGR
jgi:diadenosine tetraphosphatase ApaH/serine/threonine PP2A family protein phosphatase